MKNKDSSVQSEEEILQKNQNIANLRRNTNFYEQPLNKQLTIEKSKKKLVRKKTVDSIKRASDLRRKMTDT